MKRILLIMLALLVGVLPAACGDPSGGPSGQQPPGQEAPGEADGSGHADEEAVRSVVEGFGRSLQQVSLLAPADVVKASMEEHYGEWVAPDLLAEWQSNPEKAPGRRTSSPWPDRIEIASVEERTDGAYEVSGAVIEVTSVEQANGGEAGRHPITLLVERAGERWQIFGVTLGEEAEAGSVVYANDEYGFRFPLPESWQGYSIVTGEWEGAAVDGPEAGKTAAKGPLLSIRHPEWTEAEPRQDIPILIFTLDQWEALQRQEFHIGAAPIGPKELGRNNRYVFALPARYNSAFPAGYEEVEEILDGDPLQPYDVPPAG